MQPLLQAPLPKSGTYYVVLKRVGPERHPQRNMKMFRARIYAVLSNGTFHYLRVPHYTLCRAVHLPWRNIGEADVGLRSTAKVKISVPSEMGKHNALHVTRYGGVIHSYCRIQAFNRPVESFNKEVLWPQSVYNSVGYSEATGILLAFAFGLADQLSERTVNDCKQLGIYHLLILSGLHLSLLMNGMRLLTRTALTPFFRVFCAVKYSHRQLLLWTEVFALLPPLCLTIFTGFTPSCSRAFVWLLLKCVIEYHGRKISFLNHLVASLFVLVIFFPGIHTDAGLWLTVCALVGIYHGTLISRTGFTQVLTVTFLTTAYSQGFITAVFGEFSIAGVVLGPLLSLLCGAAVLWLVWIAFLMWFVGFSGPLTYVVWATGLLRDGVHLLARAMPESIQDVDGNGRMGAVFVLACLLIHLVFVSWTTRSNFH
jgi:ComEC/Rec2-related protein